VKNKNLLLFFLLCIISRLLFTIYYIEDIDSLRFALSTFEFNIANQMPHFPGYPIYCFILKVIFLSTKSLGLSFSLIGGISIFLISIFLDKIWVLFFNKNSLRIWVMVFFTPLLFLMSTRYMPDILGLAFLIMSLYFFLSYMKTNDKRSIYIFSFLLGLEMGVRLSFMPFFLPCFVFLFFNSKSVFFKSVFIFLLSNILWIIPFVFINDFEEFFKIALNSTEGHFTSWGGGIISEEGSLSYRFFKMIESIFSDGLGGYWKNRHWLTISLGLFWFLYIIIGLFSIFTKKIKFNNSFKVIFLCCLTYFIWIFFFQNIIYKPRHILPFLPFIILIVEYCITFNILKNKKIIYYSSFIFFLNLIFVSSFLSWQHTKRSSISQIKEYVLKNKGQQTIFFSSSLMNFYFSNHSGFEDIILVDNKDELIKMKSDFSGHETIFSSFEIDTIINHNKSEFQLFYHNPYVNRLWYKLPLYTYNLDEK